MIATETRTCRICGKDFEIAVSRTRYGRGKFCGRVCSARSRVTPRESRTCRCGTVFEVRVARVAANGGGTFCSVACHNASQIGRPTKKTATVAAPVKPPNRFGQPEHLTARPVRQPVASTSKTATDDLVWSGSNTVRCAAIGCGRTRERGQRCQCERMEVAS